MKKILLLTSRLPYPPIGGDRLKNFNLLKILFKYFDVYLVVVTNEKIDDETRKILGKYTKDYRIFQKSKLDFFLAISRSLFNKEPLQVNYYYFKDIHIYMYYISK